MHQLQQRWLSLKYTSWSSQSSVGLNKSWLRETDEVWNLKLSVWMARTCHYGYNALYRNNTVYDTIWHANQNSQSGESKLYEVLLLFQLHNAYRCLTNERRLLSNNGLDPTFHWCYNQDSQGPQRQPSAAFNIVLGANGRELPQRRELCSHNSGKKHEDNKTWNICALLALLWGNPSVTVGFHSQRPVMLKIYVLFLVSLNKP